ncbi:MAG TPA: DMT family transporter, partial [Rhodanobacteraceae bacterium]|nr:DMT family transporter [Rhodanobacteraceae bacterium]
AVLGMVISLVGVALTVGAFSGTHFASGDVLILLGSIAWALYTIGCRRWVRGSTPLETSAWTMVVGAIALALTALVQETPISTLAHAPVVAWAAILWMALAGSVLAYIFWQVGITRRGPGATAILFNIVPVSALIVAALFGRLPGFMQIAGVLVAIFGILLASGKLSAIIASTAAAFRRQTTCTAN